MSVASDIEKMESDLAGAGLSIKALCDDAGVNQSTWTRWKAGSNVPNMATWGRVRDAFARLTERAEPQARAS